MYLYLHYVNNIGNVKKCGVSIKRDEKESHEYGEVTCYNCGHSYMCNEQHLCYMRSFHL